MDGIRELRVCSRLASRDALDDGLQGVLMTTESEAKTKWCPMVRLDQPGGNRWTYGIEGERDNTNCIGSACMMWRWSNRVWGHDDDCRGKEAAKEFTKQNPLKGFCGLAGKP